MQALYRGFDGLDVSFMGQISTRLCEALDAAKEGAQTWRRPSPLTWDGIRLLVSESGARGGYAFIASTGEFGATWFFKRPNPRDPWGVRVSCNSFNLAVHGLGGARSELYRTLGLLGINMPPDGESIGRVDYALDFLAPDFVLLPEEFVMHSNSTRADHIEDSSLMCSGRSGRVTSVTVGKMPGQQVIVYDKRSEIIAKRKPGWWEIWNAAPARVGCPPLEQCDAAKSRVWRVELRSGKVHLKDRWNIRRWADLDSRCGDMMAAMLQAVRHTRPMKDTNRSRWPDSDLWLQVRQQSEVDLFEMRSHVDHNHVKQVQEDAHDQLLSRQMLGLLTARAALKGIKPGQLETFASETGTQMALEISRSAAHFERKLHQASGRYRLGAAR